MDIIELLTPSYEVAWLPWAVQYFFLVGISASTAIVAAGCAFGSTGSAARQLLPVAITVLLTTVIAAPVSLLADLHQPARFWHFYAHFTPWSWMSLGAYLLPVFVTLSLGFAATWWLGRIGLMRLIGFLLALSAVSILVYTGAEVMVLRSRPLWSTVFLPINFALTGWLSAMGAMLLVARWLPGGLAAVPTLLVQRLSLIAVALLIVCASAWVAAGFFGQDTSYQAALRLFELFPVWRLSLFSSLLVGLGLLALLVRNHKSLTGYVYSLLVAALMLSAAWVFRWVIFMSVQGVPKYGAGLYIYNMPLGGDGLLGMVGVFGLCIALIAIITWALDIFPGKNEQQLAMPSATI